MSRHLVNALDMVARHTPGQLHLTSQVDLPTGTASFNPLAGVDTIVLYHDNAKEDARRIVACWNACLGMPTEDVEQYASADRGVMRLVVLADDYRIQRDELLAALLAQLDMQTPRDVNKAYRMAEKAIAKVRGAA